MPKNRSDEEPDEQFPFHRFTLREIEANSKLAHRNYNSLYRYAKSQHVINKHLRRENKRLYQENILFIEKNKTLKNIKGTRKTVDGLTNLVIIIATTVITIGITIIFTLQDQRDLGILISICGFIIAIFATSLSISTKKQRRDGK